MTSSFVSWSMCCTNDRSILISSSGNPAQGTTATSNRCRSRRWTQPGAERIQLGGPTLSEAVGFTINALSVISEHDTRRRQRPDAQQLLDLFRQLRVQQVARRKVQRHLQSSPPAAQGGRLADAQVQHRERERADQRGLLDDRNEFRRRDKAVLRVLCQRTSASRR